MQANMPNIMRAALFTTLSAVAVGQAPATTTPAPEVSTATPPAVMTADPLRPVRLNGLGQTVLSPKIRNITKVASLMPLKLTGIGLVTGLPNTGSSDRATRQAVLNAIRSKQLNLTIADLTNGSTALVALTCELPPFATEGMRLDVKCASLGDAQSLRGGVLLSAELNGPDGKAYVVASGQLTTGGYVAAGRNASVSKNPNATADLMKGGEVIENLPSSMLSESGSLELRLRNPSAFNASSVARGIATALAGTEASVEAVNPSIVRIELPDGQRNDQAAMRVLTMVGDIRVSVENPSKVTIDQVSGTVLAGESVLISPCVVGVSELTIAIVEEDFVSQPNPFSDGTSERVGRTRVEAQTNSGELQPIGGGGATVADLLQNLKTLGLTPQQLVQVFIALDKGGFLHADLEIQ